MKKILSLLSAVSLTATTASSVIACNTKVDKNFENFKRSIKQVLENNKNNINSFLTEIDSKENNQLINDFENYLANLLNDYKKFYDNLEFISKQKKKEVINLYIKENNDTKEQLTDNDKIKKLSDNEIKENIKKYFQDELKKINFFLSNFNITVNNTYDYLIE